MHDAFDILSLRQTLGWSQMEMARYLGLNRSTVSRLENGSAMKKPVQELLKQLMLGVEGSRQYVVQRPDSTSTAVR